MYKNYLNNSCKRIKKIYIYNKISTYLSIVFWAFDLRFFSSIKASVRGL